MPKRLGGLAIPTQVRKRAQRRVNSARKQSRWRGSVLMACQMCPKAQQPPDTEADKLFNEFVPECVNAGSKAFIMSLQWTVKCRRTEPEALEYPCVGL